MRAAMRQQGDDAAFLQNAQRFADRAAAGMELRAEIQLQNAISGAVFTAHDALGNAFGNLFRHGQWPILVDRPV
ncbi:hypothetical protein D3C78_1668110 [compost metagenome]